MNKNIGRRRRESRDLMHSSSYISFFKHLMTLELMVVINIIIF